MAIRPARPLRFKLAGAGYQVGDLIGYQHDNPVQGATREQLKQCGFVEEISHEEATKILMARYGFSREKALRALGAEIIPEVRNLKPPKAGMRKVL